jgi:hypothetical protein
MEGAAVPRFRTALCTSHYRKFVSSQQVFSERGPFDQLTNPMCSLHRHWYNCKNYQPSGHVLMKHSGEHDVPELESTALQP